MSWKPSATGGEPAWIGIAAALLAVFVWAAPAQRSPTGTGEGARAVGAVSGTVRLLGSGEPPRKPMLSPYARPRYRPPAQLGAPQSSPETVVVYLVGTGPPPPPTATPARIVQRGRTIIPHVTVVQTGTRVEFPNDDDVFHNIFSLSGPKRFNLGRYPPGESRSEVFAKAGVVRLFCDIHSEMSGVIMVVDTPYFTQPDAEGRFRIPNVTEGEYTAVVWQEAAGVDSMRVVVRPGEDARMDVTLGGR